MYTKSFIAFTLYALASHTQAAIIRVDVGQNGLSFTPNNIKANLGDMLEFHFHPSNHSVAMGDFNVPCQPAPTKGFFSGFMPVSSGEAGNVFQYSVNSSQPTFFYCTQNAGRHCQNGMSGVINPSSDITLGAYQNASKSIAVAVSPAAPFGGQIVAASSAMATKAADQPGGAGILQPSLGATGAFVLGLVALFS